jgi:hypothetical protein
MDKDGKAKDKLAGQPEYPSFEEKVKAAGIIRLQRPKARVLAQPNPSKP